jgi:uridine kinase
MTDRFSQTLLVAPPEYIELHAAIVGRLGPERVPMLIGIDGRNGSGKSSCGAWLSWQLNMPCINLDPYAKPRFEGWHIDHLRHPIKARLERNQPIIIEGCLLLRALAQVGRKPDFLIFIENSCYPGSAFLHEVIEDYLAEAKPREIADFCMRVQFEGPTPYYHRA